MAVDKILGTRCIYTRCIYTPPCGPIVIYIHPCCTWQGFGLDWDKKLRFLTCSKLFLKTFWQAEMKRKRQDGQRLKLESDDDEQDSGLSDNLDLPDNQHDNSVVEAETKNGTVNKPPTGEELRVIKDATDLYRSNSFKLQVKCSHYILIRLVDLAFID